MSRSKLLRLGVLASGGGSNLQSIIDRCHDGSLAAEITLVLTNRPDAGALQRAARAGIAHQCIDHRQFSDREAFDRAMIDALRGAGVELVVLAGFMRIITPQFLDAFPQRVINIHPALLPAFPGLHVQQQAIDHGARFSGCTVHFVDSGVDTGPILIQAVVPILPDDDADSLAARILEQEHRIYPRAIQLIATGRVRIDGRKVIIDPPSAPSVEALVNPSLTG
ncbi:MAG: phosphoribosylglycinamide formyltransferase [Desulfuromonadales bacterium]|nr:phosphoribosylglycinamide formyltransferase [Desulfuromonadales bacterium]